MRQRGKFHYGYLIVLTFVMCCFGPVSFGLSCAGLFFTPVAGEFGVSPGMSSYFITVLWIVQMAFLPFMGKMIATRDARLCTSLAVIVMAVGFLLLSCIGAMWQYFCCAALVGFGVTMLLMVAPSTLINRWFNKRSGFLIGLCMAFTGVGGVVWNSVGGIVMEMAGWRMTYLLFAVLTLVLALPLTLFVVRGYPSEKGLVPYGGQGKAANESFEQRDVSAKIAFKRPSFAALCVFAFLLNSGMYVYQMIPSYATSLPASADFSLLGATAAAVAMAAQTIAKVVEGIVGERKPGMTIALAMLCGMAGIVLMMLAGETAWLLYAAAGLFGCYYAVTNVMLPILTRRFYGVADYSIIYARVSIAASLGCVVSSFAWGTLIDVTGGYTFMFLGVVAVMAFALAAALMALQSDSRARRVEGADEGATMAVDSE